MHIYTNLKFCLIVSLVGASISGCSVFGGSVSLAPVPEKSAPSSFHQGSIESVVRALPTAVTNSTQPAHYDHVYVDSNDPNARSLKTISLKDAIDNNVLASSSFPVIRQEIDSDKLKWNTFGRADPRPTSLEGVGGFGVADGNFVEVNFDVDKTDILNKGNLEPLIAKAGRVSGIFYVVGYADETGIEAKNKTLSQNRATSVKDYLLSASDQKIHPTRILDYGAGVSRTYPDLASNRRTSISFKVDVQ